jgi:hypothetical protein
MKLPPDQHAVLAELGDPGSTGRALLSLAVWGSWLAYLGFTKRYFGRADEG